MATSGERTTALSAAAVAVAVIVVMVSVIASVLYYHLRRRMPMWHRLRRCRHHPSVKVDEKEEEEVGEDDDDDEVEEEEEEEEKASSVDAVPLCCSSELAKKPQYVFKHVLADNSYAPFAHLKRTLKEHPYEDEVTFLLEHPPVVADLVVNYDRPAEMGGPCVWVHTQDQLESLANRLSKERIFAVDTEQHTLRSFLGFTALMQISTGNDDFLLDTIALHDSMSILQPVFANSSICKVFHGGDNDVLWLQRDFHIYVVNMFDTAKACMVLSKPKKSLAYLLETYCGVATNKMLQREDWRKRPLSAEMTQYARTDVHYLLYIVHRLASELKMQSLACCDDKKYYVNEAYRRSNMGCMQLYAKEVQSSPGDSAAASIILRYANGQIGPSLRDDRNKDLIRQLCSWRELMARIHDESLQYILSDKSIIALGVNVPKGPKEIYSVIRHADSNKDHLGQQQLSSPSPVVKGHIKDICLILCETMENPENLIRKIFQIYLTQEKTCPRSIYNYALLSDLNAKLAETVFPRQNGRKCEMHVCRKASRQLFVQKFSCKSPVYHNCRIYASDGRLLCYCDQRKIDWYIKRELAKIVEHDPPGIVLLFEPKGHPEDEDNEFYIQKKKNICVGCGEKNHYLRYRIIPSCYRIHFPEQLKSHRSHDIVLLCVDCHEIAHAAAEKYKKQVAEEFKIPLFVRKVVNSEKNKAITISSSVMEGNEEAGISPLQLRTAAMALMRHGSKMPFGRREELLQIIRSYSGKSDVSTNDIEEALLVGMSPHEKRKLERKRGLNFKVSEIDHISVLEEKAFNERLVEQKNFCIVESANDDFDDNENGPTEDSATCLSSKSVSARYAKKLSLLGHGPHGQQVVDYILKEEGEEGIIRFCQKWRQVFVQSIQPRFLPAGWDVMHSGRREFGLYSVYNPSNKPQTAD